MIVWPTRSTMIHLLKSWLIGVLLVEGLVGQYGRVTAPPGLGVAVALAYGSCS